MRVLNTRQMREADRRTIEDVGIASLVLMENAGRQVVAVMESSFENFDATRIAVLCGRGNNGGDGFVIARVLVERGLDVGVYLLGQTADVKGDARANLDVLRNIGGDVIEIADAGAWELHGSDVLGSDLVVDALFGTGLNGPLTGLAETVVADLNASDCPVVSVDLPSGLSADTADVPGPAVDAPLTVALAAPKLPLVLPPAEALAGRLVIADIGIPSSVIRDVDGPWVELLTRESVRALIEPRSPDSHKGDYGHVLVVAGSPGRTGAASLAARGALRSGAGLVTIATPRSSAAVVAALGAEYMTLPVPEGPEGMLAREALEPLLAFAADVLVVGPGLGRSTSVETLVQSLVERSGVPLVLDADALNAFAAEPARLVGRDSAAIVITPHPGEMARLTGLSVDDVQANRLEVAREFASTHRVYVVLKGHRTVIATPDGKTTLTLTGNPGMATGGTGDVLAGMIGAWLGQLHDPDAAVRIAVYLHGVAGDQAAADEGEAALVAGDIADRLGDALLEVTSRRRQPPSQPS
jgi:NAD(P)H-hydrate epimerase